jgi:hypothetical protein
MLLESRASHVKRESIPDDAVAVGHTKQSEQSILPAVPCPPTSRLSTSAIHCADFNRSRCSETPAQVKSLQTRLHDASSISNVACKEDLQILKGGSGFTAMVQDILVQPDQALLTAYGTMQATEWCMPGATFLCLL